MARADHARPRAPSGAALRLEPASGGRAVRESRARYPRPGAAPWQGAVVQQPARCGCRRRGGRAVGRLRRRGVRHHQAHHPVRHRAGALAPGSVRARPCHRPHFRLRLGDRVQRRGRSRRRGGDRYRCGPDVARGRLVPRDSQGAPTGARSGRGGVSFRRVLSVRGRCRRSGPGGSKRDHPAGRLGEGRRGGSGGRSGGGGDGVHGHPTVQALTGDEPMSDAQTVPHSAGAESPPYLWGCLVAVGTLVLYGLTLAPTTQFWDASEYIAAAHALGIPHPPGNPFFIILAHVWGLLPLAGDYARRINLLAATTSALTAGIWFLIAERWLRAIVPPGRWRRVAATAGTLVGCTTFTVWNQSVVNEKVYTLSMLTIALVLWLAVRWADQPEATRRDHHLVLIVYLLALSATNHLMGLLVAPAVLVYVLATDPRVLLRPRFLIVALLVAVVGTSVNLFIPIRAHFDPYMNQGEATTWPALKAVLTREQFGKPSVLDNPMYPAGADNPGHTAVLYGQQLLNYVQYFTWQFGRDWGAGVQRALAVLFAALGLLGARHHWRAERRAAVAMTALMLTLTAALVFYLNFKWGYSQPYSAAGLEHEVRERDYFFIASFAAWGIWVGIGLATLMAWIQEALPARRWALSAVVLLAALVPLVGNWLTASRSGETMARDYAHDVLQSVDPYALLVTAGDNDTFPLWYAQEVEGVRKDVSVLVLSLANTDWYLRQLQRRPPEPFAPALAPALYRDRTWPRPASPWMSRFYLDGPADTLPPYLVLPHAVTGRLGPAN